MKVSAKGKRRRIPPKLLRVEQETTFWWQFRKIIILQSGGFPVTRLDSTFNHCTAYQLLEIK